MEELIISNDTAKLMPALSREQAQKRRSEMAIYVKENLKEGVDYGVIPGCGTKPTLLKPGAEHLLNLFGYVAVPEITEKTEDWTGENHNGEPFFYYIVKTTIYWNGVVVGSGIGSCNSWEVKYRWRTKKTKCPLCQSDTIKKSNYGGFYCNQKGGGCGAKFDENDTRIKGQSLGREPNPDIFDQVNTLQKMAMKRSHVAATLSACGASEYFTQDLEDISFYEAQISETNNNQNKENAKESKSSVEKVKIDPRINILVETMKALSKDQLSDIRSIMQERYGEKNPYHLSPEAAKSATDYIVSCYQQQDTENITENPIGDDPFTDIEVPVN